MMTPALAVTQNESMLRNGNAMSRAPIMSGMQKFPKAPARIGMITKKIMMVACMVNAMLYVLGSRMPPVSLRIPPRPGTAVSGHANCQRTTSASRPPRTIMKRPMNRNCRAIILWSVEKIYVRTKPSSWCSACATCA